MNIKMEKIKNRNELEYYVSNNVALSPNSDMFNVCINASLSRKRENLCSDKYKKLLGVEYYIEFPDSNYKEIIENISLGELESETCRNICEKRNIPWFIIMSYKVFLMELHRAIDLGEAIPYTEINCEAIENNCNFYCKEWIDGLTEMCVPPDVLS